MKSVMRSGCGSDGRGEPSTNGTQENRAHPLPDRFRRKLRMPRPYARGGELPRGLSELLGHCQLRRWRQSA